MSLHVSSSTTMGAVVLSALQTKLADGPLASKALGVDVEGGGNAPSVSESLFASVYRTP